MKKTRFTETQIVSILKKQESGMKVADICREHGISDATFFNWKSKYGGMQISDVKKMKDIEAENSRLKRMYAELSIVNDALKELIEKKF
jgi:putative transposase